jgi:hypothetical protein
VVRSGEATWTGVEVFAENWVAEPIVAFDFFSLVSEIPLV